MCQYGNGADQIAQKTGMVLLFTQPVVPCTDGHAYAAPVGSFSPNAFGLHDMHGNVWEWLEDCMHNNYKGRPPTDGSAWGSGDNGDCNLRIVRGGSWSNDSRDLRSARRSGFTLGDRGNGLGLRLGRTILTP